MRKLILGLMLLALTFKADAQKIDTCIKTCIAAKITPINYSSGYPIKVDTLTRLGVFNYIDDLKGSCVVNYVLMNSRKENIVVDSYTLSRVEYDSWDGFASSLLGIVGLYLRLTFKNN